ncbi:MAG TPA: hypothetical protein VFS09_06135 [Candidatus Eisenbacteria bacterium]|nr:hypothetical protein [Candidatus Eisenbacteria bacterium]
MRTLRRRAGRTRLAALLAASALLAGCAGGAPHREQGGAVPTDHPRIALLPFENLTGREDQGRHFTQAFLAELAGSGAAEVVDMGQVEATVEKLRIRAPASPDREQLAMLAESLQVRYVLLGSVMEARMLRTADGETPAAGVSLRLVETATAKIVWAAVKVKTGDEHESVFGWGREDSAERLLTQLAEEMLRPFRDAGDAWRKRTTTNEVTP